MKEKAGNIWKNCLNFIKTHIPGDAFKTWFAPIIPIALEKNTLTIQVQSKFYYEWLESHYIDLIRSALQQELGKEAKLVYNILMEKKKNHVNSSTINIPSNNQLNLKPQRFQNHFFETKSSEIKNPFIVPGIKKMEIDPQLNPNYTFENFIEGSNNRLARSAGLAVAKKPGGTAFNPLFIYGNVGLGKTHLVNAIGLETKKHHPEKIVLYLSTERFTQQFIDAIKNNARNDFVHFYQMIDVLILDDIHFLSGKKATQEVFFSLFNHLHQRGKQIVLTSDKPHIELTEMEHRLISRFKWGLSAELQVPDYSTRKTILESKIYKDGLNIPKPVIEYIAEHVNTNVREIEGILISLIAQSSLNKKEISLELTREIIENFIKKGNKEISVEYIERIICDYFKISREEIQSKTRKRAIVQARQMAMYFAKEYTDASLALIGSKIGKRDHTTVIHACKTIENLSKLDLSLKKHLEIVDKKINV